MTTGYLPLQSDCAPLVQVKKRAATLWKPGESGDPAERPLGSRNNLSESVIQDIAADWAVRRERAAVNARKVARQ